MTIQIPPNLKSADISRFALRAAQVEKAKPIIAYWFKQIITKGLHNVDHESKDFTTGLMDKLEQIKAENLGNDALSDDMAAQAYVEVFASEVFQRADNAVRANMVSRQTADTFLAAATFLDILQIWAEPDAEAAAKSKYAKYHALRITKALKAGLDPNESNPKSEPLQEHGEEFDPRGPDYESIEDKDGGVESHSNPARQPFVEDLPEDVNTRGADMPTVSAYDEPLQSSVLPSAPQDSTFVPSTVSAPETDADAFYHDPKVDENMPSPMESSPTALNFGPALPGVPDFIPGSNPADTSAVSPARPTAPSVSSRPGSSGVHNFNDLNSTETHGFQQNPVVGQNNRYPSNFPPPSHPPPNPPTYPYTSAHPSVPPPPPTQHYPTAPGPIIPAALPQMSQPGVGENYIVNDQAISHATKHAKWAISALNFEDVKTAVKELRGALESLGARQ
ncbi:MAG: hypothetical protein M1816_004978 [Peltula sp. TS41687]|nr:MAG: hypothetical protein M1816_004978 [Peltula sp. TS41687]